MMTRKTIEAIAATNLIRERTLTVYGKDDKILAVEMGRSNARRSSVQGPADQKQLGAMIARNPKAVRATINTVKFRIRNGRSSWDDRD